MTLLDARKTRCGLPLQTVEAEGGFDFIADE